MPKFYWRRHNSGRVFLVEEGKSILGVKVTTRKDDVFYVYAPGIQGDPRFKVTEWDEFETFDPVVRIAQRKFGVRVASTERIREMAIIYAGEGGDDPIREEEELV